MNGPAAMKLLLDDGTEISGRAFGAAHQPSAVPRPNRLTSEKCHKRTHALQTRKHDDRKKRTTLPPAKRAAAVSTAATPPPSP
jgi:hypothetical protein